MSSAKEAAAAPSAAVLLPANSIRGLIKARPMLTSVAAISVMVAVMGALAYFVFFNKPAIPKGSRMLCRMETSHCIATALSASAQSLAPPEVLAVPSSMGTMSVSRPYDTSKPDDYYGVVTVSAKQSAVLSLVPPADDTYYEVVIYKYPSWEVVYADTCIREVPFDFLEPGNYSVMVFSPSGTIEGSTRASANLGRRRPAPQDPSRRKTFTVEDHEARNKATAEAIASSVVSGRTEIAVVDSVRRFTWPGSVYTWTETIFSYVPEEAAELFVVVPSYGYITEGTDDHIGPLVHEGNLVSVYRVVGKADDDGNLFVKLSVVYPNISPASPVKTSPSATLYIFA